MQLEAIMRRTRGLDGLQAGEAPDTVIDVHHEVARVEAGALGDEVLRPLGGAAPPHQPVAEDVLLGDDREIGSLEAGFEAETGERDLRAGGAQYVGRSEERRVGKECRSRWA